MLEEVDDESSSVQSGKQSKEESKASQERGAGISVGKDIKGKLEDCDGEPFPLQLKRWMKIANDYNKQNGEFDISKIPEICDNIKFDNLHMP